MTDIAIHICDNCAMDMGDSSMPALSVLVPYYHDDPAELLASLCSQVETGLNAEILLYDDGTANAQINTRLQALAKQRNAPVKLMFAANNKGRSAARNALQKAARGDWILFLDADMMPEDAQFLQRYLDIIEKDTADVVFGGFTMPKQASRDTELHRAFSQSSDCLSAQQRMIKGPQYVCSSNLAARRDILTAQPFDTEFTGWGWEDSEWAARIAKSYRLLHIDNPALHLGLESTDTLLRRFRDSASNYDRFTKRHPDLAQNLKLYRMMTHLRKIPGQKVSRPLLSLLVQNKIAIVPMRIRLLALKLWRASWYAERCSS